MENDVTGIEKFGQYKTGFLRESLTQNHGSSLNFVQFVKKWTILDCIKIYRKPGHN